MVRLLWGTNQGGHEVGDVTGPQIQLPDPLHLPAQLLTFPLGPPRQTVAGSWAGGDEVRGQPLWQPPTPPSFPLPHSPTQLLLSQQRPLLLPLRGNQVRKAKREAERRETT